MSINTLILRYIPPEFELNILIYKKKKKKAKSFGNEFTTLVENLSEWIVYQTKSTLLGIVVLENTRIANLKSRETRTVSQEHPDI